MCGILGYLTSKAYDIPKLELLRGMRDRLAHRGPDDSGEYVRPLGGTGPFVYLGHRRLSIIDVGGGHQPLSNEDGTAWVTFNGEIYNFLELRSRLKALGHRFNTDSDTEVIVHAYEEYGEGCFVHFNGMFAIGIWNESKGRLILARDRLGKKPLYYSLESGTFLFASELKALLAYPRFSRKVDPRSFMKYLFYEYVPCPHTIFENSKKVPPASYLVWEKDRVKIRQYWSPLSGAGIIDHPQTEEVVERLTDLLRQSVRKRLISDVPLGVFLSGGIDSSTVAAFAQKEVAGKVKTFSIGFEDPSFDESNYASCVSQHLGTEHYEKTMVASDLLNVLPDLPDILDEPMADASILPTYLLSRFTRNHVKVALGGDGGDELFAGYPTYLAHKIAEPYQRFLGWAHPVIAFLGNKLPVSDNNISFDFKVKKFLSGIGYPEGVRNSVWLGSFSFPDFRDLLSPEILPQLDSVELVEEIETYKKEFFSRGRDGMTFLQFLDLKLYLQEAILVKVDRASMACSLEVRAPLLDHELVEYVMGLPANLKLRGMTSKYILKKMMREFLPRQIIQRGKKGFGVPIAKWVKGPLKDLFEDLLSPRRIKEEGFLNSECVSALLKDHLGNRKDHRKKLWTLLVWELWVQRYHPVI